MKITTRDAGKVRILDLKGKLNHGEGDQTLRDAVKRLLSEGRKQIVLNMEHVDWIDSPSVGELVACLKRARQEGGDIKLAKLSKPVLDVLVMVRLHTVFDIQDDDLKAVGTF